MHFQRVNVTVARTRSVILKYESVDTSAPQNSKRIISKEDSSREWLWFKLICESLSLSYRGPRLMSNLGPNPGQTSLHTQRILTFSPWRTSLVRAGVIIHHRLLTGCQKSYMYFPHAAKISSLQARQAALGVAAHQVKLRKCFCRYIWTRL